MFGFIFPSIFHNFTVKLLLHFMEFLTKFALTFLRHFLVFRPIITILFNLSENFVVQLSRFSFMPKFELYPTILTFTSFPTIFLIFKFFVWSFFFFNFSVIF